MNPREAVAPTTTGIHQAVLVFQFNLHHVVLLQLDVVLTTIGIITTVLVNLLLEPLLARPRQQGAEVIIIGIRQAVAANHRQELLPAVHLLPVVGQISIGIAITVHVNLIQVVRAVAANHLLVVDITTIGIRIPVLANLQPQYVLHLPKGAEQIITGIITIARAESIKKVQPLVVYNQPQAAVITTIGIQIPVPVRLTPK